MFSELNIAREDAVQGWAQVWVTHGSLQVYPWKNLQVWKLVGLSHQWSQVYMDLHVSGDASTHPKYLWDYGYLFIILLHFRYLQFLFIEIFVSAIIFENCNRIHNIHVKTTKNKMDATAAAHITAIPIAHAAHSCPCPCCGGSDVAAQCLCSHLDPDHLQVHLCSALVEIEPVALWPTCISLPTWLLLIIKV